MSLNFNFIKLNFRMVNLKANMVDGNKNSYKNVKQLTTNMQYKNILLFKKYINT